MKEKKAYFSNLYIVITNFILKNSILRRIKSIYYYIDSILLIFIKKPKKTESKKKKVVISYNLFLGDGAMFITSLKSLRIIYPENNYEITLMCQKGINSIYEKLGIFDKVIPIDFTGSTINLKNRIKTLKELRKEYYDIALDPIGIEECTLNVLMNRAICADKKYGIINVAKKMYCSKRIYEKVYTNIAKVNDEKISYIEQYNEFFNSLSDYKSKVEFVTLPCEEIKQNIPKEYFIVYPSASTEYKRWPIDRFAELTKKVYKKLNIPIMICGTSADEEINNKFKQLIKDLPLIDMTNKTNLLQYITLIKNAKFIITNDTGIYHIATVSQVPVAIIVGGYTYNKFVKYEFKGCENYRRPIIIVSKNTECFDCGNRCKYKVKNTWPCLESISVEDAWEVINKEI